MISSRFCYFISLLTLLSETNPHLAVFILLIWPSKFHLEILVLLLCFNCFSMDGCLIGTSNLGNF